MAKSTKKFYAVLKGKRPGIYDSWFGQGGAHEQVDVFPGALYRGFPSFEDAFEYAVKSGFPDLPDHTLGDAPGRRPVARRPQEPSPRESDSGVLVYTDGGCIFNPGPGGYGVVLIKGDHRKELSGGFRLTTNNRMELMACIEGLRALRKADGGKVTVYSDSRYLVDGITKGWAARWKKNGWMRDAKHHAENADLWSVLLDLVEKHKPSLVWVKGHAGNKENERCDMLARQQAVKSDLPPDLAYERGETAALSTTLF